MVRWMTALVGLLAVGCGSAVGNIGRFDASGFRHERYRYGVQAGPDGAILSRDWRLDNFQQTSRRTVPKSGPAYRSDVGFDTDGASRPCVTPTTRSSCWSATPTCRRTSTRAYRTSSAS